MHNKSIQCKNCNYNTSGKFCSNCGQKTSIKRISLAYLITQITETILMIERGMFYTIKELSLRPGNTIRDYLKGKRAKHFKPLSYVITISTIYFIVTKFGDQGTWLDDIISGWMLGAKDNSMESMPPLFTWFANNYAYATLILLPVFSFASYLSFKMKS